MALLHIFGSELIDQQSIDQIKRCVGEEDLAVLTADAHYGYGHPIGGVVAYKNKISLSGVGFDIACGNKAVRTDLLAKDIDVSRIMDEIVGRISFGVGRPNNEPVDDEVFDQINRAAFKPQRRLLQLAREQLGTVGSGNHYVDLFEDEEGWLWIGVHFGSRGFGHKTAMGFIALSKGLEFTERVNEGSMEAAPILFDVATELGQDYLAAMHLAGEYAYAGRNAVVAKVLEILGAKSTYSVHNHHNFAWKENHFGEDYWVVRKGCTPAFPGQQSFVGSTMFDESVILEGIASDASKQGLFSTVHGAGRVMSRNEAAGKKKWIRGTDGKKSPFTVGQGKVNFDTVKTEARNRGIELRGGAADEAPQCYKKLGEVLACHEDTIRILHRLRPIGVAMAGVEVYDPYKD
ncbi:MAG: RtcB family protein [Saprospiraceae bacterium]|nr:RtcB family protein [Saprospiraceae bacterium]